MPCADRLPEMLIDTCVWIDWLNGRENTATRILEKQLDDGDAWLAGVILQELLQGARSEREYAVLYREFWGQSMLQATDEVYALAGSMYARCRWRGVTIRSPHDCLIAALALGHEIPLLTLDRDFLPLADVEPRLQLIGE